MSDPIIRVEHLGKLYYLGGRKPRAPGLPTHLRNTLQMSRHYLRDVRRKGIQKQVRQTLTNSKNYLRRIKQTGLKDYLPEILNRSHQNGKLLPDDFSWIPPAGAFWVLKDVSFEVKPGEVIGIIGRNGAGKSTLLKILSRITEPTVGKAVIHGRIGSLLEVGTGFHDELSGRENIYLNGTILGMKKLEIDRKLDEIVAFSGVERFLDTPVKYYSSGMRVRLAFSVAAHLDTEILLIDEVLAVGDVAFQEKCLKKMNSITQAEGRTVLFVTHNMSAIASLCPTSILLEAGRVVASGPSSEIIPRYYESVRSNSGKTELTDNTRTGSGLLRFTNFFLEDINGNPCKSVRAGDPVRLVMEYTSEFNGQPNDVMVNVVFANQKGHRLFGLPSDVTRSKLLDLSSAGRFVCTIPSLPLIPGNYEVDISCLVNRELTDKIMSATSIIVTEGDFYGTGRLPISYYGNILVSYDWATEPTVLSVNTDVFS
ncbi:MAG: ATP-binding cassette domain-containing protein [Anaerolineae bacterium]|nr:ATP-binding cassette domain-containing protein [Anaerolineae bacterium]